MKDTVLVNDRWGTNCSCAHGSYYTCDDRYVPGSLMNHKWESCMTMDQQSWGYRRNMDLTDVLTIDQLIATLAQVVALGGNLLLNVGPTADGRIVPIFEERLRQMGCWLFVNGESIYNTTPWRTQNDSSMPNVW